MEDTKAPPSIDWRDLARTALGSAFVAGIAAGALYVVGKAIEGMDVPTLPAEPIEAPQLADEPDEDDEDVKAALLLGVAVDAPEDAIRAALRERLATSQLHPDHGGDGEEATRLIAARNHLVARARAARAIDVG